MADRFDLDAIDADDALLDLLAAGGESARTAGRHDPAVALLADLRLAVEVEGELPIESIDDPESFLARCAALNPITDPFARKVAARGLALGVAAVAALSVSGVAAAVNGDPLSPYEKVIQKMVDAVRPQTSFPKEQLDGLPVVDRTKIVKVAKDFQQKAQKAAEEKAKAGATAVTNEPPQDKLTPPLARPLVIEQPTVIQQAMNPPATQTTQAPEKTGDDTTSDPTTTEPTTTEPIDPPVTQPTDPPATEPTDPPATTTPDPVDPPPTTAPTEAPPTDPPSTQDPGTGNSETGTDTGNPTTAPTGGTSQGDTTGSDPTGTDQSGADQPSTDQPSTDQPSTDQPGTDPAGTSQEQKPADTPPADAPDPLSDLVDKVVAPILPTPTGVLVENETAQQFFGAGAPVAGTHSSGQTTTGSVREVYPTGRHSSGQYAEGRHAAIARAHGSTADADVLKILDVVNKPVN
jgi:hypothetical protein